MNHGRATRKRVGVVLVGMGLAASGLLYQLIRVQFGPYAPIFAAQTGSTLIVQKVAPTRGLVFDRGGELLATNATLYYVEVEVAQLTEQSQQAIASVLAELTGLPHADLQDQLNRDWIEEQGLYRIRLTKKLEQGRTFPITIDRMGAEVLQAFLDDPSAPDLSGLALVPTSERVYPSGKVAGHVLGFVNREGEGFFGVEGYYDDWLAGKPITVERGLIPPEARLQPDAPAGVNLVLTIDLEIQQMVESELEKAIERSGAEGGQVIVMDPRNGEILAMAAWPALDPNQYDEWLGDDGGDEPIITPAVGGQFEPGSTFKVLTMASALDMGAVAPEEEFIDTGEIEVGGHLIRNWNAEAWGPQSMIGCLQHSLNVCLAYVASEKLGAASFYSYLNEFGIGQPTGIDLASEVSGQLRTPRHPLWTEADLGTNAFGQGVSVTPVQLLTAIAAVANEGVMVQPHVVREVVGPQGVYWPKAAVLGRPISQQTARSLTRMLTESLEGESSSALLEGYQIAGKTGTAQVPTDFGYDPNKTVASFVGWGPVGEPRFIVLVRLDKPSISPWGSVVAAPVFRALAERLVVLLEIPPDAIREQFALGE